VCHPGGPKVIDAVRDALGLDEHDVALTRESLARVGNLSSASVLHVLEDTLRDRPPRPGSHGLMLAMGPGFCSELVLLRATGDAP
jgi:alkylresorcinol/alkylpyrone synthase